MSEQHQPIPAEILEAPPAVDLIFRGYSAGAKVEFGALGA